MNNENNNEINNENDTNINQNLEDKDIIETTETVVNNTESVDNIDDVSKVSDTNKSENLIETIHSNFTNETINSFENPKSEPYVNSTVANSNYNNSNTNYNNAQRFNTHAQPYTQVYNNQNKPYTNSTDTYYNQFNIPQPTSQKKKTSVGIKVLISIIIALLVLCIGTITVLTVYVFSNGLISFNINNLENILPTLPSQTEPYEETQPQIPTQPELETPTISPYIDPNSAGIPIKEQPQDISDTTKYSASYAYEKCSPSVVSIASYEPDNTTVLSEGSGVIISSDGYILSNSHVINDTNELKTTVTIADKTYNATTVGFDVRTDLAVLKIKPKTTLVPASFVNSSNLKIGQEVVAIGNPGGAQFSKSITKGIISSLDRHIETDGNIGYIQTDAAINPGNSGGPLVNLNGDVIGINTIKIVDTEFEGMGFAIPSNFVKDIVDDLIKDGKVKGRVKLGITVLEINEYVAKDSDLPTGIQIESFDKESALNNKGLKKLDIITHLDGEKILSISQFYKLLDNYNAGDTVKLTIYRKTSDKSFNINIKLLEG